MESSADNPSRNDDGKNGNPDGDCAPGHVGVKENELSALARFLDGPIPSKSGGIEKSGTEVSLIFAPAAELSPFDGR